ncbi:MAG: hypothetical protein ACP5R0_00555 [Thermoplasmata archaeon]
MKTAFINGKIYKRFKPLEICNSFVLDGEKIVFTWDHRCIYASG